MPEEVMISFHTRPSGVVLLGAGDASSSGQPAGAAGYYDPGEQKRVQEEKATIQRAVASLNEAARGLSALQERLRSELPRAAVAIGVAIASRLVHERIDGGEFAVEALVRELIEKLGAREPVHVHLHPEDVGLLQRRLGERQPQFLDRLHAAIVPDASLKRGDCRAETQEVSVSAELETQLDAIHKHLVQVSSH